MKICFVTREVPPNVMGGIGTYVENMGELLAADGHEVTFVTQWHPEAPARGAGESHVTEAGIRVYYLPFVLENWVMDPEILDEEGLAAARMDLSALFARSVADALGELIPRHGFDVIEAPEYEAPLSIFLGRRLALPKGDPLRSVPCVVHLHSPSHLIFEHNDDDLSAHWILHRRRFEMLSVRLADAVLAPSRFLARQVAEETGAAPSVFEVIPYPVGDPLPEWDFSGERPEGFHFLFVGRIEPRKGVFEWVEAAIEVARGNPRVFFHFVGGPHVRATREGVSEPTSELLRSMLPPNLEDRFLFHERVPRKELGRFYYQADCCAVPSRWDNYPNTCMEAMRCGKPVLASPHGGMAEMIEPGISGFVADCPYGDRRALKRALADGMRDVLARSAGEMSGIGLAARERIESLCDNRAIVRRHLEWYESLARKRRENEVVVPGGSGPRLAVGLFLGGIDSSADGVGTARSVGSGQDGVAARFLVRGQSLSDESLPDGFREWERFGTDPNQAQPRGGFPDTILKDLVAAKDAPFWTFLLPGMVLGGEFAQRCLRAIEREKDAGFCLVWQRNRETGRIEGLSQPDATQLLLQSPSLPVCGVFRAEALRCATGTPPDGFYLGDILKDYAIRILRAGWSAVALPEVLAEGPASHDPLCLSRFGFHSREDSRMSLLRGHADLLDRELVLHTTKDTAPPPPPPVEAGEGDGAPSPEPDPEVRRIDKPKRKGLFPSFGRKR